MPWRVQEFRKFLRPKLSWLEQRTPPRCFSALTYVYVRLQCPDG